MKSGCELKGQYNIEPMVRSCVQDDCVNNPGCANWRGSNYQSWLSVHSTVKPAVYDHCIGRPTLIYDPIFAANFQYDVLHYVFFIFLLGGYQLFTVNFSSILQLLQTAGFTVLKSTLSMHKIYKFCKFIPMLGLFLLPYFHEASYFIAASL